jgi:hypothetical protein
LPRRRCELTSEDFENVLLPIHVEIVGQTHPFLGARSAQEASVLCTHAEVLDVTELRFEELSISSRNNVDDVARIRAEGLEALEESGRGDSCGWVFDDRGEGTVVVEEEEAFRSGLVLLYDGTVVERRGVLSRLFTLEGLEELENVSVSPDSGSLGHNGLVKELCGNREGQ